jgi:hypothetical protein
VCPVRSLTGFAGLPYPHIVSNAPSQKSKDAPKQNRTEIRSKAGFFHMTSVTNPVTTILVTRPPQQPKGHQGSTATACNKEEKGFKRNKEDKYLRKNQNQKKENETKKKKKKKKKKKNKKKKKKKKKKII